MPRVAVEFQAPTPPVIRLTLRGGYFFEWTPTPAQPPDDDGKSLLDASRHVLCIGLGLSLTGKVPLDVDLFGQAHLLQPGNRLSGQLFVTGATLGVRL